MPSNGSDTPSFVGKNIESKGSSVATSPGGAGVAAVAPAEAKSSAKTPEATSPGEKITEPEEKD